jgi:hypothetical protein
VHREVQETRLGEGGLVGRDRHVVVFDVQHRILQQQSNFVRRTFDGAVGERQLKAILAVVGHWVEVIHRGVVDHGDKAPARPEPARQPPAHLHEFGPGLGVHQQPGADDEVEIRAPGHGPGIFDAVFDTERLTCFLFTGQLDHPLGNVDPDHLGGTGVAQQSREMPFTTGDVEHAFPLDITDELHE